MRLGQRVYLKSRKEFGVIHQLKNGQPSKVKLDTGEIVDILNLSILVFNKLKLLFLLISNLFSKK